MSNTVIFLIVVSIIMNFLGAFLTSSFYYEVFNSTLVLKKWVKVLLLVTPLGIVGLASVILIAIFAFVVQPFEKYFEKPKNNVSIKSNRTIEHYRTIKPNKEKPPSSKRPFIRRP